MKIYQALVLLAGAVAVLSLSACGGGSSDTAATQAAPPATTTISQAAVVRFLNDSIAATSDVSSPVDINSTDLATDDTSEPAAI
jgi:hypothetical protein